jgi:hypothetical protein
MDGGVCSRDNIQESWIASFRGRRSWDRRHRCVASISSSDENHGNE